MNALMLLIGAAAAAPPPAQAAPPVAVPAPVKRDLRCFLLYAAALGDDDKSDEQTKNADVLGAMYFYGKLKGEAPELKLFPALRDEGTAMETDPKLKDSATACDTEFHNSATELDDVGTQLEQLAPQKSPSS